jgi:hypothetical protein
MTMWKNHRPHARDCAIEVLQNERAHMLALASDRYDPDHHYYGERADALSAAIAVLEEAGNDR